MSIKSHWQKNKTTYVACGATAVVTGVVVCVVRSKIKNVEVQNKIVQIMSWKPKATLEVYIEALGDPGNIVQDLTTGSIYASQGQAAKELGLNPGRVSEQIRGIRDTVNGHQFKVLGKASVVPLDDVA